MNINITTNGNKKLLTKNKYCREDITINTQVASSVNLFEYYKTIAIANCDLTEIFPTVEYNNHKIAAYFTLEFSGDWSDDPTFGRNIILKSNSYRTPETIYTTVNVSGIYDSSSCSGHYTCSYKAADNTFIEFASGNITTTGNPIITLALNTWCRDESGYIVSNTTSTYPAIYIGDFTGSLSDKQYSAWGNVEFKNLPMNVKIR